MRGIRVQLHGQSAADVVLGNWDVAGMEFDNLLVDKSGAVWNVDNGGSLRRRAQGGLKGDARNSYPTELWTLRNAQMNPQTAQILDGLGHIRVGGQYARHGG